MSPEVKQGGDEKFVKFVATTQQIPQIIIHLRKASERSSSWTLSDGHFPLKMLSNTVEGPAPSISDDATKQAAAFAAATLSDMVFPLELKSLLPRIKLVQQYEIN
jgi:hypothetical protein